MAMLGQTRRITAEFTAATVDTDPTTVTLTITAPDGTVTTPVPTHDGAGKYHHDLLLDQEGIWSIDWTGTGAVPAEASTTITVTGKSAEGPCDNWITWGEIGEYCTPPSLAPALQDAVLAMATRTLWKRSCKQFGLCTIERARVTPLCQHRYSWRAGVGYYPSGGYAMAGLYANGCACGSYHYIDLGADRVAKVGTVWVNGVVIDPASYRVDDWQRLVRTDGNAWPSSAMQPDRGGTNTVEVTWSYGLPVPDDGKMACALLACKIAKDTQDDCEVSPNATSKSAEGVTIQIIPTTESTGVFLVEAWLAQFHCGEGGIFDAGAKKATTRVGT